MTQQAMVSWARNGAMIKKDNVLMHTLKHTRGVTVHKISVH